MPRAGKVLLPFPPVSGLPEMGMFRSMAGAALAAGRNRKI